MLYPFSPEKAQVCAFDISDRHCLILELKQLGIAGVMAFLLTEDITKLPVLVDKWTVLSLALLLGGILTAVFTFGREKPGGPQGYDQD